MKSLERKTKAKRKKQAMKKEKTQRKMNNDNIKLTGDAMTLILNSLRLYKWLIVSIKASHTRA